MTKLPKAFLAVSLTAFAVGSVVTFGSPEIPVGWTVGMPVGAIFFGLFLVTFMLQKEVARFDEEELRRLELAAPTAPYRSARMWMGCASSVKL